MASPSPSSIPTAYNSQFYSFGGNQPVNSNSLITTTGYTSLWVGAFEKGARCTRTLDRGRCLGSRLASLPPLSPHPRLLFRPFFLPGFAFFGVATGIFGFMSYVRNVKPEARLVYYLVRAHPISSCKFRKRRAPRVTFLRRPAAPPCR